MGVINKIRERTGLAVGIIALGLILFLVGGDLLSMNSILLGRGRNIVGEIAGEDITLEEFQNSVQLITQQYRLNYNKSPDASVIGALRDQAWQQFISRIAYQQEYDKLGLIVSEEELIDMVQGDHIREDLKQSFKNEETGEFDKDKLQEYLQKVSDFPAQQQWIWYNYEENLRPTRLKEKYDHLLTQSIYVTRAEIEAAHEEKNKTVGVRYLYIPYDNLPDSSFSATEKEARAYLKAHKEDYQRERSRKVFYVSFPITPSAEDTAYVEEEAYELLEELAESTQDSLFATANSDGGTPYQFYSPPVMPEELSEGMDTLRVGHTIGPILQEDKYIMYKISATKAEEGDIEYMRASHILIKSEGEDAKKKGTARKKAEKLLRDLRRGADFAALSREHSEDPSASEGGDLGWFPRGRMVAPFEEASFGSSKKGLIPKVVETDFGFHIINVTGLPTKQVLAISTIEKDISARDESRDLAYQKAADFLSYAQDTSTFLQQADTMNLFVERVETVAPTDTRLGSLSEARALVLWLYNTAESEEISDAFELEEEFVVAVMVSEQRKGTANYAEIAEELKSKVLNQKKGRYIMDTLQEASGTLDELVQLFPSGTAYVYSMSGLRFSDTFLRNVGNDPKAIGTAFSLKKESDRSAPIATENGVLLLELSTAGETPTEIDNDNLREQLKQIRETSLYGNLQEAVEAFGKIEDERYKFF